MEKKIIKVVFQNKKDFRNRIASLWQNQKNDEEYEFIFPDLETEEDFIDLVKCFENPL